MNAPTIEWSGCQSKLKEGAFILTTIDDRLCILFDSRSERGVERFVELKSKIVDLEYGCLIDSDAKLNKLVQAVPSIAWDLLDAANKSLLLLLKQGQFVSPLLLGEDGDVLVRKVIDEDIAHALRQWPIAVAAIPLMDEDGFPAERIDEGDPMILEAVDYILNLPDPNRTYTSKAIPIIALGTENEVKVVRS